MSDDTVDDMVFGLLTFGISIIAMVMPDLIEGLSTAKGVRLVADIISYLGCVIAIVSLVFVALAFIIKICKSIKEIKEAKP